MCYITYSFIKRNEWGNPLFIIEWGEKMELLESIKEMVLPLIEQNDCYLDDIEYVKDNNEIKMVVDASPALAVLDKLVSSENSTTGPVAGQPTNTQLIKQLTDELEQALGILNPMVIEDLNKEIQEEHTDPELIREALKEAVFNRKTNWNYIKGVLRNWKLSGITTKIQVEERRLEHQGKKQHHQVSDEFKTGMDAARQMWGGQ